MKTLREEVVEIQRRLLVETDLNDLPDRVDFAMDKAADAIMKAVKDRIPIVPRVNKFYDCLLYVYKAMGLEGDKP